MTANSSALRGFWFARLPWRHRRLIFLSRIVSASITGLDAYAACRYPRALSKGKAHDSAATEGDGRSWTNDQLLHKWEVLPARAEIAIRRVKWLQAMTEHNHAHLQTMAAIWRQLPGEAQTLTAEGFLSPTANPFAVAFSEDLHLFAGLSGTEDFSNSERKSNSQWYPQRRRQRFLPAHRLQTHANSGLVGLSHRNL